MQDQDVETRLAQLKREVPTRGLERHPLIVKAVTDLPPELQSPDVTALAAQETLQTIIKTKPSKPGASCGCATAVDGKRCRR